MHLFPTILLTQGTRYGREVTEDVDIRSMSSFFTVCACSNISFLFCSRPCLLYTSRASLVCVFYKCVSEWQLSKSTAVVLRANVCFLGGFLSSSGFNLLSKKRKIRKEKKSTCCVFVIFISSKMTEGWLNCFDLKCLFRNSLLNVDLYIFWFANVHYNYLSWFLYDTKLQRRIQTIVSKKNRITGPWDGDIKHGYSLRFKCLKSFFLGISNYFYLQ